MRGAGEGQREGEKESQAGSVLSTEPNEGLKVTNLDIVTSAEIKSQRLNRLSHPGAPGPSCFKGRKHLCRKEKAVGRITQLFIGANPEAVLGVEG